MQCEVHEAYVSEEGLVEHSMHIMDARAVMFEKYASGHRMSFFGPVSQRLVDIAHQHADEAHMFSLFQGLEEPTAASRSGV